MELKINHVLKIMDQGDKDDLYAHLGSILSSQSLNSYYTEFETIRSWSKEIFHSYFQTAQDYLRRIEQDLREKICVEYGYCQKKPFESKTTQQLIDLIAELIATLVPAPAGIIAAIVILVAAILVKIGLNKFCNCD